MPPVVHEELRGPGASQNLMDWSANLPNWVEIREPASAITGLESLDAGERTAITLALEISADQIIIDESSGRRAALLMGLEVTGTIGVLFRAAQSGLIDLDLAFDYLRKTDFFAGEALLIDQLKRFRSWQLQQGGGDSG